MPVRRRKYFEKNEGLANCTTFNPIRTFIFLFWTAIPLSYSQQESLADSFYMLWSYPTVFCCIRPRSYR